jgi:signal peptidase I
VTDVPSPRRSIRRRLIGLVAWLLLAIVAFYMWPSQWGGGTTYVVVRGTSMQPSYRTGDIVIARSTDHHEVGDVLVYAVPQKYNGAGKLIMHRLKSIQENGRYIIQGDNRDSPDDFEVRSDDVVGVAKWHIPRLGLMAQILGQWWFIAGLVAAFALLRLWPDDDEEADEAGAATAGDLAPPDDAGGRRRSDRRRAERRGREAAEAEHVELPPPVPNEIPASDVPAPVVVERPARAPVRAARAQVFVDGDGLARAGWPDAPLDEARQRARDAADDIGRRFGTPVALIFEGDVAGLDDCPHAFVELVPDDSSIANVLLGHVGARRAGLAALVVTDDARLADQLKAGGGSVMRCAAWLALGERVGATLP